jgi:hypothetical protein
LLDGRMAMIKETLKLNDTKLSSGAGGAEHPRQLCRAPAAP